MINNLKPCPFCGGTPEIREYEDRGWFYVVCLNVKCRVKPMTQWDKSKRAVRRMWNRRAT